MGVEELDDAADAGADRRSSDGQPLAFDERGRFFIPSEAPREPTTFFCPRDALELVDFFSLKAGRLSKEVRNALRGTPWEVHG